MHLNVTVTTSLSYKGLTIVVGQIIAERRWTTLQQIIYSFVCGLPTIDLLKNNFIFVVSCKNKVKLNNLYTKCLLCESEIIY